MRHAKKRACGFGLALLIAVPLSAEGQVTRLPISAWLDAQIYNDYTSWTDPAAFTGLAFDAFGKRAEGYGLDLGTTVEGTITVRALADGRGLAKVVVHTHSGICWASQYDENWENFVRTFGWSPSLVAGGATASLGEGTTQLEFTMPSPDSPLPAYWDIDYVEGYSMQSLRTTINCSGELRVGAGYPDGTPGAARTTQVILFTTGVPGGCPPETDENCAPTEFIKWWATGAH